MFNMILDSFRFGSEYARLGAFSALTSVLPRPHSLLIG